MVKLKKNKENKKIDAGKIAIKIVSFILAILMVLSVAVSFIYYMINMQ